MTRTMPQIPQIFSYLHIAPQDLECAELTDSDTSKLAEMDELLQRLLEDREAIEAWLGDPQEDFGGETPKDLIFKGEYDEVLMLIKAWASGSFG
ncbi:hypothetical protein [Streptomyces sp. NBC_00519]|uniref:hypothetical protein n=1 Tax=Streptomyces sp. NBC_00519 TaxID=2975764 RepID=UPI0030E244E9